MAINTIVPDPEKIIDLNELEDIILRIKNYEIEQNCSSGVLLIQRKQFGAAYRITCENEAKKRIDCPGKCEWGIKLYPRSYFEEKLKEYSR